MSAFGGKADIDQPLLTNLDMLSKSAMESCGFRERGLVPSVKTGWQFGKPSESYSS
jgi:hypothetical protein